MIARLSGSVAAREAHGLIIDVGGVGYRVFTTTSTIERAPSHGIALWTHLSVRENALDLFGFETERELVFFTHLISVSGIGPRSAIAIMNLASVDVLTQAIAAGDTSYLTKVAGIGKKSAEKIVVELRDKLAASTAASSTMTLPDHDALLALTALGYTAHDAREALKQIPTDILSTSERVKAALRELGVKK